MCVCVCVYSILLFLTITLALPIMVFATLTIHGVTDSLSRSTWVYFSTLLSKVNSNFVSININSNFSSTSETHFATSDHLDVVSIVRFSV